MIVWKAPAPLCFARSRWEEYPFTICTPKFSFQLLYTKIHFYKIWKQTNAEARYISKGEWKDTEKLEVKTFHRLFKKSSSVQWIHMVNGEDYFLGYTESWNFFGVLITVSENLLNGINSRNKMKMVYFMGPGVTRTWAGLEFKTFGKLVGLSKTHVPSSVK